MPLTNAEVQASFRRRRDERIAELTSRLGDAEATNARQAAEIARLERERDGLSALLEDAPAAPPDAGPRTPDCPHPAHLVDGDRCTGCGQVVDVW